MRIRVSGVALLLPMLMVSCGGPVQPPPQAPQVAQVSDVHQCKVQKDVARPMLVEWPAVEKAGLQSSAARGVVVVRYDGCRLSRMESCSVQGSYEFLETSRAKDGFKIKDKNELFAKLPLGAVSLEGELRQGNALDLAYVAVGTRHAQVGTVTRDMLPGGCEGATHFVRSMVVGAYELSSEYTVGGGAALAVGGAGAGGATESQRAVIRSDGDLAACVDTGIPADSRQCQAIVQLVLEPIAETPLDMEGSDSATERTTVDIEPGAQSDGDTFLYVRLEKSVTDSMIFVDETMVGSAPWRGPVSPGKHIVQVVVPGMRKFETEVEVSAGSTEILDVPLVPEGQLNTGIFYIALPYEFAVGQMWVADEKGRAFYSSVGPELNLGFHVVSEPVWWEVGAYLGWAVTGLPKEAGVLDFGGTRAQFLCFGLLTRLLFGLKGPYVYWALELQPGLESGAEIGGKIGISLALRGGFSFFLNDWIELRVLPVGIRAARYWRVEFTCDEPGAYNCDSSPDAESWQADIPFWMYNASVAIALRI